MKKAKKIKDKVSRVRSQDVAYLFHYITSLLRKMNKKDLVLDHDFIILHDVIGIMLENKFKS